MVSGLTSSGEGWWKQMAWLWAGGAGGSLRGEHSREGAEEWEERKKREWSWQAWGGFATTGAQGLEGVVALGAP